MEIKTERLLLRRLQESDREAYFSMMSNPNVMNVIPRPVMSHEESDASFDQYKELDFNVSSKIVFATVLKDTNKFIGLSAYLTNDEGDPEIGYRLLEKFWRVGYGTEIARALIDFGFQEMKYDIITADCSSTNEGSQKILNKIMRFSHEFWNENDNCFDQRYVISYLDWVKYSPINVLH